MAGPDDNSDRRIDQGSQPGGLSSIAHEQVPQSRATTERSDAHHPGPTIVGQNVQRPFNMASMAAALPTSTGHSSTAPHQSYGHSHPPNVISPAMYPSTQPYFQPPLGYDPSALVHPHVSQHQQQYAPIHYDQHSMPIMNAPRHHVYPTPPPTQYVQIDPYAYAMNAASYAPLDPRYGPGPTPPFVQPPAGNPTMVVTMSPTSPPHPLAPRPPQYHVRHPQDSGPVPSYPRGPPRKPKQSGHALWVGNLPPAATVIDLKDHFSREATDDIESVFLIAKSNCAFVNYRTETACAAAMNRFHDSRFHGVRLVCRLRRASAAPGSGDAADDAPRGPKLDGSSKSAIVPTEAAPVAGVPAETPNEHTGHTSPTGDTAATTQPPTSPDAKVPEKYFIVKSLTVQDLEASVRNRVWATQSHNEDTLNRAYEQADNVYLIFSANKSGEYFGYARMTSPISGAPINLAIFAAMRSPETPSTTTGEPQSIPTEATATAPKGRIIDDSARGTIFWEAVRSTTTTTNNNDGSTSEEQDSSQERATEEASDGDGQNWGRQFSVEWMSTTRLPFYRTRGLRNPWNANREVKIARDGTELEPSIARRLVQMFHRPANSPQGD